MKLVLVEWVDAKGVGQEWADIVDPIPDPSPCRNRSVGWLAHKDDESLVIIPHLAQLDGDREQGCGDMTIPIGCVVQVTELGLVESEKAKAKAWSWYHPEGVPLHTDDKTVETCREKFDNVHVFGTPEVSPLDGRPEIPRDTED